MAHTGGTANIDLQGINPTAVTMWDDSSGDLWIKYSSTDEIEVFGGSYGSSTGVSLPTGEIAFDSSYSTTWNLGTGLNLIATSNSQSLYGTYSGGDTLTAAGLNENLYAFGGTETLVAGVGATLNNGTGTDTDVFTAGTSPISNEDWIVANASGTAIIDLHGINPTAVTMWDDVSGHLWIQYSSTDAIEVFGGSYSSGTGVTLPTGEIAFDSSYSTTWNLGTGLDLIATSTAQSLYGTSSGGDTLTAAGVNEYLYAYGGTETLVAGVGVTLNNGTGTDTDVFTAGASPTSNEDWIIANASGTGIINLHGINPTAVTVWDDTSGHLWVQYSSTDVIEVFGGSYSSSTGFHVAGISEISFDSSYSTTWTMTGALNLTATHDSQSLYGTGNGDNMDAQGNNDSLYGIAGNNTMTGSSGSSDSTYYYGGSGNDLMIAESGTNYMTAGTGADTYKIETASSSDHDYGLQRSQGRCARFRGHSRKHRRVIEPQQLCAGNHERRQHQVQRRSDRLRDIHLAAGHTERRHRHGRRGHAGGARHAHRS